MYLRVWDKFQKTYWMNLPLSELKTDWSLEFEIPWKQDVVLGYIQSTRDGAGFQLKSFKAPTALKCLLNIV